MSKEGILFEQNVRLVKTRNFSALVSKIAEQERQTVYFCNTHMLMLSKEDPELALAMQNANWIFPDGVPITWLQKRMFHASAKVIRGYEILLSVCERAENTGERIGFFGSTPLVISKMTENLKIRHPQLRISYMSSPAFMEDVVISPADEIGEIRDALPDWLFVGLGCPKQEKWIARYASELDCHVLGVGAAFDWLAGTKSMPPGWMEKTGLGWLHRLLQNPIQMAPRYFKYNSIFIYESLKLLFLRRNFSNPTSQD